MEEKLRESLHKSLDLLLNVWLGKQSSIDDSDESPKIERLKIIEKEEEGEDEEDVPKIERLKIIEKEEDVPKENKVDIDFETFDVVRPDDTNFFDDEYDESKDVKDEF